MTFRLVHPSYSLPERQAHFFFFAHAPCLWLSTCTVKTRVQQPCMLTYEHFQAKDKTEMTPLHVAASQGSLSVAKCLIEAGADLRSLDEEQMTPLHFACMEGSLEVAQLLFETGV